MKVQRGDVLLAHYPFAAGTGAARRPVLVVQNDRDNQRLQNTIVAQITSNVTRANEPTHLLVQIGNSDDAASGLLHDSVVSCNNLVTIHESKIDKMIGHLPEALMQQIDVCLRVALGLL